MMRIWLRRSFTTAAIVAGLVYLAFATYLFAIQRSIVFRPDARDVTEAVSGLPGAEAVTLATSDGETINAWWKPPQEGRPVYLYLHGNGANLTRRSGRFQRITEDGAGLLAVSWRGYGGSTGSPSEAGFRLDGAAAYDWLAARVGADRIVLFGESLGTGIAIWLASERPARLLALDSPYASIADLGAMRFPWLPVSLLSLDPFRSVDLAPKVTMPVIAQHCTQDWLIPLSETERLMRAFPQPPRLIVIEGRCHIPDVSRLLLPAVRASLAEARPR